MSKRVGQILKEVREEKGLSVKDVSRDTNMALKFVIALENEDYAQFPGETFTVGFLKTYADYLKIDSASIMDLYKGEQLIESQQPLDDLTRPTVKMIALELEKNKIIPISIILAVILIVAFFAFFYDSSSSETSSSPETNPEVKTTPKEVNANTLPDIPFVNQSVPENSNVPFTLIPDQGFSFSVNNQQCKIFIKSVKKSDDKENIATIGFNIFPERKVYTFETKVGTESLLSFNTPELSSLRREIKITTQSVTDNSAKILVKLGDQKSDSSSRAPIGDVPIQVTLYFIGSSYVEFIIDGQTGERGLVQAGETKQLEARDMLEIKVGNGGVVEISQNGKERTKLGKAGRLVRKIFQKVQNPLDSTQFTIRESGE